MSDGDITVDDLLSRLDDMESQIEELDEQVGGFPEEPEIDIPDEEIDARTRGAIEHLIHEDCDGEWCESQREGLAEMVSDHLDIGNDDGEDDDDVSGDGESSEDDGGEDGDSEESADADGDGDADDTDGSNDNLAHFHQ